ncbi:UNVERIFIED_CONTAM: hypothetical protein K2H54_041909 [Gekko kuhli]
MDPGPQYRLEKQNEPNVPVDLDCTLESQSTLEFCLVRENIMNLSGALVLVSQSPCSEQPVQVSPSLRLLKSQVSVPSYLERQVLQAI